MVSAPASVSPASTLLHTTPELLAPAGDWDCAKAAVENGADAIYFGLDRFNARMRAHNFTEADLPELMAFLHQRGVKGYVTVNTLIFSNELDDMERYLRSIITAGVDAAIVQDVGLCRLIRHLSPDFPIHASTQMTVTSAAGVAFAQGLGCELVVLARECSIGDIEKIQAQTAERGISLPLEVFVHGALCVAYSGQCLTSESLGGRSANRGECAQACRMTYDLVVDGKTLEMKDEGGDRRYLLSPQDLSGLPVLPELVRSGVSCLKIEGRLKSPEYVASVTKVYRQALDRALASLPLADSLSSPSTIPPTDEQYELEQCELEQHELEQYELEMAFSRGLHTGWFEGIDNQALVHARYAKKRGVYLGIVKRIQPGREPAIAIRLQAKLKPGDGVVFAGDYSQKKEQGGRVYSVENQGRESLVACGRRELDLRRVNVGDRLYKTSDPELERRIRQTFHAETPQFKQPIQIEVQGQAGESLVAIARDKQGHVAQAESRMPLEIAQKRPLTPERLQAQLGRLGNTPYTLLSIDSHLASSVILPISELNRVRRTLVDRLDQLRSQPKVWQLHRDRHWPDLSARSSVQLSESGLTHASVRTQVGRTENPEEGRAELIVLVRRLAQLQAALETGMTTLYCELEDPPQYREAIRLVREATTTDYRPKIWVAPPRITKPKENYILEQVRRSNADGYLIRNYDQLAFFAEEPCIGDFSLNVANSITAQYFKTTFGLERLTASYDLNAHQLEALLQQSPAHWFEVTIHQHMPMFHMEHCVFCAFLSEGKDFRDCGRPCETHIVKLRDRVGKEHFLQADAGCRNTLYNSTAQTGAEAVQRLFSAGLRHFRIEFLQDSPQQVQQIIQQYQQLLQGQIEGQQLWRKLKLDNRLGVTRGTLELQQNQKG